MSVSAAQAAAFFLEAAKHGRVFTIRDERGFPAPLNGDGRWAQPFWSLESRARTVIDNVSAYAGFVVEEIPLDVYRERWLPGLERDGIHVGINWSGEFATGYDLPAASVVSRLGGPSA